MLKREGLLIKNIPTENPPVFLLPPLGLSASQDGCKTRVPRWGLIF